MALLTNYEKKDYATLLASEVLDASKGALFAAAGLKPDNTNRTILIGVGGTGVRTIDYVKGAISKRLDGSWSRYVAFLGIDTSWSEFDGASYLDPGERVLVTKPGVAARMSSSRTYPAAVHRFAVDGDRMLALGASLASDGAGQTRLIGKLKIHDKVPGSMGVDEEIVNKLATLKSHRLDDLSVAHGMYQIYVIGSVCGGTCSGSFTEMPSLIRKVFTDPNKVRVNAMLYLPDTLAQLDPANRSALYANGYASLKELNYYMGMYMRPDYTETWSYNDPASPELIHRTRNLGEEGFYNVPYLIGTTNGPSAGANKKAQETIAEFLISTLAEIKTADEGAAFLTSAFESNALAPAHVGGKLFMPGTNQQREADREAHEFPKRFSAIGFAEASVPQKLVRAYTVGKVCSMAGLKPLSKEERVSLAAGDASILLPFRAKNDLLNASEGTAKATKLMEPLKDIVRIVNSGDFNFSKDLNETEITWTKIKNNQYDNPMIAARTEAVIRAKTTDEMMTELKRKIKDAYSQFRTNVQDYVREEGPYAFVNLYKGTFIPVGENYGIGLGKMLQNLVDGRKMDGGAAPTNSVEDAKSQLDATRNAIIQQSPGLFGIEGGAHRDQCSKWVAAYNRWGCARINKVRRETALGQHGAICQNFMMPAAKLAEELEAFGAILETMAETYQGHGRKMNDYEQFSQAQDNKTEVNLAAMSTASYQWLKRKAEETLVAVNARKVRDNLVDHFFAKGSDGLPNSKKWLEFPQELVTTSGSGGKVMLTRDEMPVPARQMFDEIMAVEFPSTVQVSIVEMFNQLQQGGQNIDNIANDIIVKLYAQSKPQFNGNIPDTCRHGFIMYPSALSDTDEGRQIAEALKEAAENHCNGIKAYSSDDADSIMFYQVATPLELYRLYDLEEWERDYENGASGITATNCYLHGQSPDLIKHTAPGQGTTYEEVMPWSDYPPITVPKGDPRVANPDTGEVSREGKLLKKLDQLIERAKELGVLYSEQVGSGWIVKRVHCNKSIQWRFETTECSPDPVTELLPLGKDLAEAVASQNNKDLTEMSRKVSLNMGGIMDMPHETEPLAWEFAARTLRAHVPMYIEVRETVKKFEVWAEAIEKYNREIMERKKPGMMVWMVKGNVLRKKDDGTWIYVMPDGKQRNVAVLSETMMRFMPPKDKYMIENGMLGYYLFTKLSAILPDLKAFEEGYKRGQENIQYLAGDGQIDALAAGEDLAAILLAEIDALAAKGARMDGDVRAEPRPTFAQALSGVDRDKLTDISVFYFRMNMWGSM